jgi:hypothetical protein
MGLVGRPVSILIVCATLASLLATSGQSRAPEPQRQPYLSIRTPSRPASGLLEEWAGFPVQASPRPVVLAGDAVVGAVSFQDSQAKWEYLAGAVDPPDELPRGPSTADGYPIIDAGRAVVLLQRGQQDPGPKPQSRLKITNGRFGNANFVTDRGPKKLPAWLFSFARAQGEAAVLAVGPQALWSPAGRRSQSVLVRSATLGTDQRSLTAGFVGAPAGTGGCTADYSLRLTESGTAVVVTVIESNFRWPPPPNGGCSLAGYNRTASGVLRAALGARVIVDAISGQAVAVS